MNPDAIRELLNRRPFQPFEVLTSGGERHEVKHPGFAILTTSRLVVVDPVLDRVAVLALIHVTEVRCPEVVEQAVS